MKAVSRYGYLKAYELHIDLDTHPRQHLIFNAEVILMMTE